MSKQNPKSNTAGIVEICNNGEWGTICADSIDSAWSENNAQVACKSAGYSGAINSILQNKYVNF